MAKSQDISKSTINNIWQAHNLKPHRVETFKLASGGCGTAGRRGPSGAGDLGDLWRGWICVGSTTASESSTEEGGRPAFDPQLLISLWVYAYSQGIGSAREVARRCEFDPAFQWLTGLQEVNYHTLADFRVEKQKELDELFTQVLAALSKEGLVTLEQVMQDGTKSGRRRVLGVCSRKAPYRNTGNAREGV